MNIFPIKYQSYISLVFLLFTFNTLSVENLTAQQQEKEKLNLPELIGHRGASYLAPENTMASVQLAWQIDADAVEVDIYITADNQLVLMHDKTTERTGNRGKAVEEQTLEELKELEYGSWKGPQWEGEPIVTLDEILVTIPKGKRMVVETKSGPEIVEPMLEAIERSGHYPHQIVVITFNYEVASKIKKLKPQQQVLWLSSFRQDNESGEWSPTIEELVEKTLDANLDGLNLRFIGPAATADGVAKIREAGLGYFVWTVNDVEDAEKAIELGVDGITTDRPAWLKKQLLSRNGWKFMNHSQK